MKENIVNEFVQENQVAIQNERNKINEERKELNLKFKETKGHQ